MSRNFFHLQWGWWAACRNTRYGWMPGNVNELNPLKQQNVTSCFITVKVISLTATLTTNAAPLEQIPIDI